MPNFDVTDSATADEVAVVTVVLSVEDLVWVADLDTVLAGDADDSAEAVEVAAVAVDLAVTDTAGAVEDSVIGLAVSDGATAVDDGALAAALDGAEAVGATDAGVLFSLGHPTAAATDRAGPTANAGEHGAPTASAAPRSTYTAT